MLTCCGCFLGRSQPCLTGAGSAKAAFVESISARSTFAGDAFGSICVGVKLSGTSSWLLIKYGFINILQNFVGPCGS